MKTIVFRQSWFKTLRRWEPVMQVEFLSALSDFSEGKQVSITNERVMDLWDQVEPLLESDKQKYQKKVEINRENGKKGGRPRTQTKPNDNPKEPTETHSVLEKPTKSESNPKKLKDIDNDIDKDIDNDIDNDVNISSGLSSKEFYLKNKSEVEYLRDLYGYTMEEAIEYIQLTNL